MPGISIILPFYNADTFLERSVESILNQSFADFELILVNNNSTDKSNFTANKFAENDCRINLIQEKKQGVVHASETGLKYASANLIARADADDVWHPDKLMKQYDFMQKNPDIDVLSCRVNFKGSEKNQGMIAYVEQTNEYLTHEQISLNRFSELQMINPTILFRKEVAEKFGFYKDGIFPEDYEMFLRWLEAGVRCHKLPERLLDWYDHEKRLTRTDGRYSTDSFYKIKSAYLHRFLKRLNPHHPKIWVWGAGKLSKQRVAYLIDSGIELECYIDVDSKKINHKEVINYKDVPEPGTVFIVSYVNNRGKRKDIRSFLLKRGYTEGKDFILA